MMNWTTRALCAIALAFAARPAPAATPQDAPYRISAPTAYQNLAVYFLHGASRSGPVPLTLQEALAKKTVEIRETGVVNELELQNTGDEEIFIQSGSIVKGGRQDRVLSASMVLPPHAAAVRIPVFCVEHDRWTHRAGDDGSTFSSADAMLPSRAAKLSMRAGSLAAGSSQGGVFASQQRIWDAVRTIQGELSSNVGAPVASPLSRSSLQLSLENKELQGKLADYVDHLAKSGSESADIVGYVAVINGRVNSAEIYPSNALFRKMWPSLLRASATEAISDGREASDPPPPPAAIESFLDGAAKARATDASAGADAPLSVRESSRARLFEARPPAALPATGWINRSYLAR